MSDSGLAAAQYIQVSAFCSWSATALFVYEVVITAGQEIDYVWKSHRSLPKYLYLITRYVAFGSTVMNSIVTISNHSSTFCETFDAVQSFLLLLGQALPDALLSLRVMSLVHDKRILRCSILTLYIILTLLELILSIGIFVLTYTSPPSPGPDFGCLFPSSQGGFYAAVMAGVAAVVLAYNTFLFLIQLVVLVPKWERRTGIPSLFALLIRDGSLYFLLLCATMIVSTIIPLESASLTFIPIYWLTIIPSLATCRMFLNLRTRFLAGKRPHTEETTLSVVDIRPGGLGSWEGREEGGSFELQDVRRDEGPFRA